MRIAQRLALLIAAFLVVLGCFLGFVRPWYLDWGATWEESHAPLPGDEIVPGAATQNTRAITIAAPVERVWPWVAQIGQDRAGFYSYRMLENVVGCEMPRSDELLPDRDVWKVGDRLWMYPPEKAGGQGYATLRTLIPGRALGFETRMVGGEGEAGSWTFVLVPEDAGHTRLLIRGRGAPRPLLGFAFDRTVFEPVHFTMERRMMEGLQAAAEGRTPSQAADVAQILLWVVAFGLIVAAKIRVVFGRTWPRALVGFVAALAVFQILTLGQPHPLIGAVLVAGVAAILWWPARAARLGRIGALAALTACASSAPAEKRGSRGPTAADHVKEADAHEARADELARWPDRHVDPAAPSLLPDNATWHRTWDTVRDELRMARYHRGAAAALEAEYEEACGQRSYAEVSVSPLVRYAIGGGPTETGVELLLSASAGSPDALMAAMRCHRAWMMLGRTDMDDCPLDLAGLQVMARGDAGGVTVDITVADPKLVPELQRRAAHDLEAASRFAPAGTTVRTP